MATARKKTAAKKATSRKKTTKKKAATRKPAAKKAGATTKDPARAGESWTAPRLMAHLERLGTAQNRKIYARHGADPGSMFGVSFANLYALPKRIKADHDLANKLWKTGNADAQILAALVADHERATRAELEAWLASAGAWFMAIDSFATHVARTPHALALAKKWMRSKDEFTRRAGYSTLNSILKHDTAELDTAYLETVLATIEKQVHASPNRAREAMNTTVICIGVYHDPLEKKALAAAKRIGKVDVFHGDGTRCKDFIATVEIPKARAHRKKMAAKKKARKKAAAKR
jgi:3-methyladenine DNA glycosylase AlkD